MRIGLLFILCSLFTEVIGSSGEFLVTGLIKDNGMPVSDASVQVYRNTLPETIVKSSATGTFTLQLDLNQIYLVEIDKPGYYPLKVNISTLLPEKKTRNGVSGEFELELNMVEAFPGMKVEILNSPIVQIRYNKKRDRFDYDEEYLDNIRLEIQRLYEEADDYASKGVTPIQQQTLVKRFEAPSVNLMGKLTRDEGGDQPLANYPVALYDQITHQPIQEVKTNDKGVFRFINVKSGKNYIGIVNHGEGNSDIDVIYLASQNGRIIKQLVRDENKFHFVLLPAEYNELAEIYVEDPWIKPLMVSPEEISTISDVINYPMSKWEINEEAEVVLQKVLDIMTKHPEARVNILSHTDSRGDATFNLGLSEKRAKACAEYLMMKGISKERLSWKGMGEIAPVNYCTGLIECTEQQHRENRRTEFNFSLR